MAQVMAKDETMASRMRVDRLELYELLGVEVALAGQKPGNLREIRSDGVRRASLILSDGRLTAELAEEVDGDDAIVIVSLEGDYRNDGDAFEIEGEDNSGESSDRHDPRAAAAVWRRQSADIPILNGTN